MLFHVISTRSKWAYTT